MPRIAPPSDEVIAEAAAILRAGSVVAFPTETVYGLGAATFDAEAIARVYDLKGRPADNPLIVHVIDAAMARAVVSEWDARCDTLAAKFWPGPLTLVLPRRESVPAIASAGLDTIAVRAPRHPVARRLLERFEAPISAPSANRSGRVSPTSAAHVAADFADVDDLLIIDGGACELGIESTVVQTATDAVRVLRPGSVSVESLREALGGEVESSALAQQGASPGTAPSHYAPRTPSELIATPALRAWLGAGGGAETKPVVVLAITPVGTLPVPRPHQRIDMPQDAVGYARRLYAALREADAIGVSRILIERPPQSGGAWAAIQDRLRRATAK